MVIENKANFVVNLTGNVGQKAKAFGRDIASLGDKGSRSMRLFSAATGQAGRLLDFFDNKFMGFAVGGGGVLMAKKIGNLQQKMTELGTQFNLTGEQISSLDKQIWSTSAKRGTTYDELSVAISKVLERANDFNAVTENMDNIALAIRGIGISAEEAGDKIGILKNKGMSSDQIYTFLNDTANLSKVGTGNIKEQFNRVVDAANGTGWNSNDQLRELMAIERLGAAEVGDSAVSTAAMQEWYSAFSDKEKRKILKINGVNPLDENTKQQKNPIELFLQMGNASKFKDENISMIVGGNFSKLMQSFKSKERQGLLRQSGSHVTENSLIDDKAMKNIQTFNGALTSLSNAGERWAQVNLAKPVQALADAINKLTPEELDAYIEKLKTGGEVIGGIVAARYAYKGYKAIRNVLSGNASGSMSGALGESVSGEVVPVFVTNWEDSKGSKEKSEPPATKGFNLLKGFFLFEAFRELDESLSQNFDSTIDKIKKQRAKSYNEGNIVDLNPHIPSGLDNALQNFNRWLGAPSKTGKESYFTQSNQALSRSYMFQGKSISDASSSMGARVSSITEAVRKGMEISFYNQGLSSRLQSQAIYGDYKDAHQFKESNRSEFLKENTFMRDTLSSLFDEFNKSQNKNKIDGNTSENNMVSGEILIKIESDKGLIVKPQSIESKEMNITVNTGNTRGGY